MSDGCLFCKIAAGDIPADVVAQDDDTLAFRDINPQAPVHVLVIPRAHHANIGTLAADDPTVLSALLQQARRVADQEGLVEDGWRLVFNTGTHGGQTVDHVHGHVLGGRHLGWPPG